MTLYTYGKKTYSGKRGRVRNVPDTWTDSDPSEAIRWSFRALNIMRRMTKHSKDYEMFANHLHIERLKRAEEEHEKELTRITHWRLGRNAEETA